MDIVWTRWLVYLLIGVPAFIWLLATRNQAQRLIALLFVLFFIQQVFSFRRMILGLSLGPSVIVAYMVLIALFLQRRKLPTMGSAAFFWPAFLLIASVGVVVGATEPVLLQLNVRSFQESFVEGFVFYLIGALAFETDEDVGAFWPWFCIVVVGGAALSHLAMLATGWRVSDEDLSQAGNFMGGVLFNPNSLGHFYAWTIPIVLLQVLHGKLGAMKRLVLGGVLVAVVGSLVLTGSRGGPLLVLPMIFLILGLAGVRIGFMLGAAGAAAAVALGAAAVLALVFPDLLGATLDQWFEEGLSTNRAFTAEHYLRMIVEYPLGVGLSPMNLLLKGTAHGFALSSAHNVYIDMVLKMGVFGLVCYLALVIPVVLRVFRAARSTSDITRRVELLSIFSVLVGFMLGSLIEPLYDNGEKLNHLFWLMIGIGTTRAARVLRDNRAAMRRPAAPIFGQQQAVAGDHALV
jgi:O-antigen ligase